MTGLNRSTCDLIEFGGILWDLANPAFFAEQLSQMSVVEMAMKVPTFHTYILPPEGRMTYTGEPTALAMHSVIFKRIAEREKGYNYTSPTKFGNSLKQFLIKNGFTPEHDRITINVAGKNPAFDVIWLEEKTDVCKHVKCSHRMLDPAILYMIKGDERIPGLSLCKQRSGLFNDSRISHCAIDDALDTLILLQHKAKELLK